MGDEKIYYVHMRTAKRGAVTFALREDGEKEMGAVRVYRLGWAFCSPRDQFAQAKGRLIAVGRLRKRALTAAVPSAEGRQAEVQEVCRRALRAWRESWDESVSEMDAWRLPRWLMGFVGAWERQEAEAGR